MSSDEHLKKIRMAEMETVKRWFKPGMRVLEIGGGSGYQASLMASYGCEVSSIDIAERPAPTKSYFPLKTYDGKAIPFEDKRFDVFFSSNVLEHIKDLPPLFSEIKRVLKSDGIAIHILPSATWRFWTSLSHYLNVPIYLLNRFAPGSGEGVAPSVNQWTQKYLMFYLIKQALVAGPHGEYPGAFSELYYFSRRRWLRLFHLSQFDVIESFSNGLFYTGYSTFKRLPFQIRRKMSHLLGSSCHIFIMRDR